MAAGAAVFAVAGGGIALVSSGLGNSHRHESSTRTQLIGEEIAMNHNKQLAVEVSAATYDGLAGNLDKLDFRPFAPHYVDSELELLGARYCSIQGNIAAQIKLVDARGRVHTLYQTRWTDDLGDIGETNLDIDGVRLHIWRERGLLMGLASPRPTR